VALLRNSEKRMKVFTVAFIGLEFNEQYISCYDKVISKKRFTGQVSRNGMEKSE